MVGRILLVLVAVFLAIQLVPYGRRHVNPPVVKEPAWDSPRTRELAARACFDCHSNETKWPSYATIAPLSWGLQRHVDEGREDLNFSEWQRTYKEADESAKSIREGEMPPSSYLWFHPEARLTDAEKLELEKGLDATLGEKAPNVD